VSSKASFPPKPSGTISWDNKVGGMTCTVKSASLPLKGSDLATLSVAKKVAEFDCTLSGTAAIKEGNLAVANGKVSIKRTVKTPAGPLCGTLESPIDSPQKTKGTISFKKTLGLVCCNLEATSTGSLRCTFDSGAQITHGKSTATTKSPPKGLFSMTYDDIFIKPKPKSWWRMTYGEIFHPTLVSQVSRDGMLSVPIVAAISFLLGCGFNAFRRTSDRAPASGEQPLLPA